MMTTEFDVVDPNGHANRSTPTCGRMRALSEFVGYTRKGNTMTTLEIETTTASTRHAAPYSSAAVRVRDAVLDALDWMSPHVNEFPWAERSAYCDWLAQTYHYVHHSTRLLAAAAARFPTNERGDALHHRFAAHMREEQKHERLCIHDLRVLGSSVAEFRERPATRMFYEPQYFKIEHRDPTALLGYILVLEVLGAAGDGRTLMATLAEAHGENSLSFVKLHCEEDADHIEKGFAIVEGCTAEQIELIEENAWQTAHAYAAMLREIREQNWRLAR